MPFQDISTQAKYIVYNEIILSLLFKTESLNWSAAKGKLLSTHDIKEVHNKVNFMQNP